MNQIILSTEINTTYEALLVLALVLFFGIYAGRFFDKFKLPSITGYIVSGLVIGGFLAIFDIGEMIEKLEVVSTIALGFIAFGIGSELEFKKLKKSGKEVIVITVIQAVGAALVTVLALIVFKRPLAIALVLGAIATATEPASIMLITRRYKARGALTDTLIPLVGMDDAVGVMLFGILFTIAKSINIGGHLSFIEMIENPLIEIGFSLLIGAIIGIIGSKLLMLVDNKDSRKEELFLAISIVVVFISVSIAKMGLHIGNLNIHMSPILTPMASGIMFTNTMTRVRSHDVSLTVEAFTNPILVVFFTLAGAELVVALANNTMGNYNIILITTMIYVVARSIGKIGGAYLGARIMKSHRNVRKYLGYSLLPQAGVALGMAYQAKTDFGDLGMQVLIIVLLATIVFALIGPIFVKWSLDKSGELQDY